MLVAVSRLKLLLDSGHCGCESAWVPVVAGCYGLQPAVSVLGYPGTSCLSASCSGVYHTVVAAAPLTGLFPGSGSISCHCSA